MSDRQEYERRRATLPHRVAARKEYMQTEAGKRAHTKATSNYASRYPDKRKAQVALNNALRDGRIEKRDCEYPDCGSSKTQAHHHDYSKPLEVVWLCTKHHREQHKNCGGAMTKQAKDYTE